MRAKKTLAALMLVFVVLGLPFVWADDHDEEEHEDDIELFGFDAEELLAFISAHLALALAFLTFLAYARSKRSRLLFVGFAFLLFAIRLYMEASELFMKEIEIFDPLSIVIDFVVLLLFFVGVLKRK